MIFYNSDSWVFIVNIEACIQIEEATFKVFSIFQIAFNKIISSFFRTASCIISGFALSDREDKGFEDICSFQTTDFYLFLWTDTEHISNTMILESSVGIFPKIFPKLLRTIF